MELAPEIFAAARDNYRAAKKADALNAAPISAADITIVIPTYQRGAAVLDTIGFNLALNPPAAAIIVVDQTPAYPDDIERRLSELDRGGKIRWIRLAEPSQPAAMNAGLLAATTDYVLIQDDDIEPCATLVAEYVKTFNDLRRMTPPCACISGQVIQPRQTVIRATGQEREFPLNSDRRYLVDHAGAGNLCVNRAVALAVGGFDENFVGTAYRADMDFTWRLVHAGYGVVFEPRASLNHLSHPTGGVRSYGNWQTTARPHHAVGSYYLYLCWGKVPRGDPPIPLMALRQIASRNSLRNPLSVPAVALAHSRAYLWARKLKRRGRKLTHAGASLEDYASRLSGAV